MKTRVMLTAPLAALALSMCLSNPGLADGGREFGGVNRRDGDPSPAAAPRTTTSTRVRTGIGTPTETTTTTSATDGSNVDEYTYQDEQVNIDGNKDAVVKVLRVNQKILVNDYVVRVFPILRASPIEIRNAFREVTRAEGGRAEVIRDKAKKEYFLYVVAPKFQMPHIEAALKELDQDWVKDNVDGSKDGYYKAQFRDIVAIDRIAITPASATIGARADNLVELDRVANAAFVSGEPYRVSSYLKYAKEVDKPVPQIQLEAVVYETDVTNQKRLGLDYIAWKNGPGRNLLEFVFYGTEWYQKSDNLTTVFDPFVADRAAVSGTQGGGASGRWMGANYMLTAAYLDFLEGSGRARVVTRGKVLIKNGQAGTLVTSDDVLHFTVAPQATAFGIVPNNQVEDGGDLPVHDRTVVKDTVQNVGFDMQITPWIGQETTELQIVLNNTNIVGLTPAGQPMLRNHHVTTTVLVQDGQEICVGGLRRTEDIKQTQKMPFLGDLPVLGWLFGHEATVKRETELVVVLKPVIRFGTEADLEMASETDRLIRQQVEKRARLALPKTEFGFDQWLIGSDM